MNAIKKNLYIDALALVPEHKSGVGVTIEYTLKELIANPEMRNWQINLVVPLGKAKYLQNYNSHNVHVKTLYLPARILAILLRLRLMPPVDWFIDSGVYLFPNYRNWPVWRSRSVTYVYDISFIKHPETVQAKNQKYLSRSIASWLRRTDRVVTISHQVKYEIEKHLGVGEEKMDIVPCGVDQTLFYRRDANEIEQIKNRYDIPYEKYFLFVGNIEPRKNLEGLLDAYSQLPASVRNEYGMVFVGGDGWQNEAFYKKLLKLQSNNSNVMKISSYVATSDLPALYSGASILIHPAIYEGFGITPLEAMACGTPVAVADIPSLREVVQAYGVYFAPQDSADMASAIQTILTDTSRMKANVESGLKVAQEFSWKKSAVALYSVLHNEQQRGAPQHPVLIRLKRAYQTIDRSLLLLFGERAYPAYVPKTAKTAAELRAYILEDFMREQPSNVQRVAKGIYLGTKHAASTVVKKLYHLIKSPAHEA